MARTRLFDLLRRSYRLQRSASRHGEPLCEHLERAREVYLARRASLLSRRSVLRASAATGAAFAWSALPGCDAGVTATPVAVVGAGLAGLVCAHRLAQVGVGVDVFEAWNRTGGRTFTARGMLDGGQICELGGELIDSDHAVMQGLAMELELTLDDLYEPDLLETYFFGGRAVPVSEISASFAPVAEQIATQLEATFDVDADGEPTSAALAAFMRLDATPLRAWLETPSHGADATIRALLDVAYTGEYGREADEQSVLNLMYLVDFTSPDPFRIFGDSDERYHVHEGSSAIAEALTERYESQIQLEHRLVAIREGSGGKLRLVFDRGGSSVEREYEQVLVTVPFSTLRDVEIDVALSPDKRTLIDELGYGQNAKLMMQTRTRPWRSAMASGAGFADNGAQSFWDSSRGQDGEQGILTHFAGGDGGVSLGDGSADSQAERVASLIDDALPGFSAARNDRVVRMHWPSQPNFRGSYACYLPGQWSIGGAEGTVEAEGRLYFAGEHTSLDYQGFMEGAAESGQRAADDILRARGLDGRAEMLVSAGLVSADIVFGGASRSRDSARRHLLGLARAARRVRA
ncbi:MAG: FAD-dependent oxidoreductase [Deltaproteobacteria bacterium]|nr:FAD-dependent oxidoreductase [Deltaproteobacteria bacterium]